MKKAIDPGMHTAEHILNQAMTRLFGCERCFSAHIEKKKSKCDYRFDRPLSTTEEEELESAVNAVIEADVPVRAQSISLEAASRIFNLSRLPASAGDRIRIVAVGDYDRCPCIGPHVSSTGAIGAFRIISTSYHEGGLRIRYKLKR